MPKKRAFEHTKKTDLCLVLGSSLTVTPINEIPEIVGKSRKGKLAICNLQDTPIDHLSELRIHSETDKFMVQVMKRLDIPIPEFILHRRLVIKLKSRDSERHQLTVLGVDIDGTPATFLESVKLEGSRRAARSEPFVISFSGKLEPGTSLKLELEFMGHYGEPNLELVHEHAGKGDAETLYLLEYSPYTGEWKTDKQDTSNVGEGTVIDLTKDEDSILATDLEDVPDSRAANLFPCGSA